MSVNQNFLDEIINYQMDSPNPIDIVNVLQSVLSNQVFPMTLDESQPEKSWWRYFQKRPADNTAMCYSCGAVFNRGPKQSTTSLNHHLKMYHRDLFIQLQQAKDAVLPSIKLSDRIKKEGINTPNVQKACFTIKLIESVKTKPDLYDVTQGGNSDFKLNQWKSVAEEVGNGATPILVKKRWIQIRDRFKKEHRFAVRDNFSYLPKWPYYSEMRWFEDFLPSLSRKKTKEMVDFSNPLPEHNSENPNVLSESSDWKNDEDFLFAKLVQVRLNQVPLPKKREVQRAILLLLDDI